MFAVSSAFLTALQQPSMTVAVQVTASDGTVLSVQNGSVTMDGRRSITRTAELELTPTATKSIQDIYNLVMTPNIELTIRRGLVITPATTTTTTRTNVVQNPVPTSFTNGTRWSVSNRGVGGAGTSTIEGGAFVDRVTTAAADAAYTLRIGTSGQVALSPVAVAGKTYTASLYVTSSVDDYRGFAIDWLNSSGATIASSNNGGLKTFLPAGVEVRLSVTGTAPAGAVACNIAVWTGSTGGTSIIRPVGSTMRARNALMEVSTGVLDYFDGSVKGASWTGTAHQSESQLSTTVTNNDAVVEYVPLGMFSTDSASYSKSVSGVVRWSGSDRSKKVARSRFTDPFQVTSGTSLATAGNNLLSSRFANVVTNFGNVLENVTANVTFEAGESSDPWESARGLFNDYGYDLNFDGNGVARAQQIPDPASVVSVFDFGADATNLVLTADVTGTLEKTYNGVIVTGEGSNLSSPIRAEVWDTDPASPTYYLGGFGKVPLFYSSPLITSNIIAGAVAQVLLSKLKGRSEQLSWPSVVNPALEPFDVVTVTLGGVATKVVIDQLVVPLRAQDNMTAVARQTVA